MRLRFFNVDEFAKDLPEVKSSKIYTKTGFHPDGLFSLQIFGPIKTATCGCQQYWGRSMIRNNHKCQTCNVDVTYSKVRRERLAKIILPLPVLNPIMYHLLLRAGKTKLKEIIENIIFNDKIFGYAYDTESKRYIALEKKIKEKESDKDDLVEIPKEMMFFKSITGLKDLIIFETERRKDKDPNWKIIYDNIDKFYINSILVLPPEFRPVSKNKDAQMRDEINRYLNVLLNFSLTMKDNNLEKQDGGIFEITARNLYRHVYSYYNYIFSKLSKKKGLIRGTILGKRVDFSGRAVIIPDPTLTLGECSIPYLMAMELFKLEICNLMLERRLFKRPDSALTKIDECIKNEDYELYDITRDAVEGKNVMLNRQPTLHRMGILSFKAKVNSDYVIKIHPLICEPYNADFDGDQMAIYRPLLDKAIKECDNELAIQNNLVSPSTGDLILGVNQDIVLGIYLLTLPREEEKIIVDGKETYKGRVLFVNCLPKGYDYLLDKVINKQILKTILNDIARTKPPSVVKHVLDNVKELGFKYTTLYGTTISLEGINTGELKKLAKSIFDRTDIDYRKKSELLESDETKDQIRKHFPYSVFVDSGSRGNWDQAKQIVLSKGFVTNFKGEISKIPIENSYISGLTRAEFFNSCHGSRKGLLDTALNTGVSGYLTRKLVYAAVNLERDIRCIDCGTKDTMTVSIPKENTKGINSKKLARSLVGKYIVVGHNPDGTQILDRISYKNYHTFIDKTVQIRSVIFCKNKKICRTCYGDISETSDIIHSNFVGVIAAQAMGEVSTQLVLRTFHTCLKKNVELLDVNNNRIPSHIAYDRIKNGESIYTFSCSPQGIIEVSKIIDAHKDRIENKIVRVTLDNGEVIETSLDHEYQMRDGSYKQAQELKKSDSLMPIYMDRNSKNYLRVQHNIRRRPNGSGCFKKEPVYWLSSNYKDSIRHESCKDCVCIQRHHIDHNIDNNSPNNILSTSIEDHISSHGILAAKIVNENRKLHGYKTPHDMKLRDAVRISNSERMKDPEYKQNQIIKRKETWNKGNLKKLTGDKVSSWYKSHPDEGKRVAEQARMTCIIRILSKLRELNLEINEINYNNIRKEFFKIRYPKFEFASKKYPELFANFELNINYNHKVSSVEVIQLPEYEYLYDFTVDSKYHNFSLASGIFIHNSGVAKITSELDQHQDITSDLSLVNKIFHNTADCLTSYEHAIYQLFKIYSEYKTILFVHFECIVSQMMRRDDILWRLTEDRDLTNYRLVSIESIPARESWLLALALSRPKSGLIDGIVDDSTSSGILELIMMNQI